eukprot:CAMPEP_0172314994 /NCGR_PEP_ID=MMETSP1058-20130122/23767_1 /TAXON_ID=83371 /ORGANISM="Detonula confervacea, Strain CCMP 353" /LENGTH=768 /DNA_ID=CAMNT_0013028971 /DNA_START=6 /DNA_END=2312 /DNA_ORIENTATION=-
MTKSEVPYVPGGEIRFVLPRFSLEGEHTKLGAAFQWHQEPRSDNTEHIKVNEQQKLLNKSEPNGLSFEVCGLNKKPRFEGWGENHLASKEPEQKKVIQENCSKVLIRSVEDAVKDEVGRRPRANSTDRELNLPQRGLCDERIILQSHKWDMKRLFKKSGLTLHIVPRGFKNLGNTCFLNATLQCLAYMPSFCQSIAALPTSCYETTKEGTPMHGQRITMFLRSLLRMAHGIAALERNEPLKTSPIAPKGIHKAITSCKINGHRFRPGRQEDAHELLVHLLDAMHEGELFAAGINPHESGWRDKLPMPRLDETTFVHRIFGGYFRSQLICNKCGYKSNTYDPFLDLALEVSKKHIHSLIAAFVEFTRIEKLDSNNRWKCSGCKKYVCPTKHLSVFRPPLSLCIHLKRFEFEVGESSNHEGWGCGHRHSKGLSMEGNGGSKILKKIDFPSHLSLPLSDGRVCQYLLNSVIIHVGNSATTGHYTSFVKQPGGSKKWCHVDDSHVEMVSENTVLKQRDAYVLFYTRKEVKLEFPPPPPREHGRRNGIKLPASTSSDVPITISSSSIKHRRCSLDSSEPSLSHSLGPHIKSRGNTMTAPENSTSLTTKSDETYSAETLPSNDPTSLTHANESKSFDSGMPSPRSGNPADIKQSLTVTPNERNRAQSNNNQIKATQRNSAFSCAKKMRTWNTPGAVKLISCDENILLGNIAVGNWNDKDSDLTSVGSLKEDKISLRYAAIKEMETVTQSRKRQMFVDFRDSTIDEIKRTKKKKK